MLPSLTPLANAISLLVRSCTVPSAEDEVVAADVDDAAEVAAAARSPHATAGPLQRMTERAFAHVRWRARARARA
jgi:hypothetical protein